MAKNLADRTADTGIGRLTAQATGPIAFWTTLLLVIASALYFCNADSYVTALFSLLPKIFHGPVSFDILRDIWVAVIAMTLTVTAVALPLITFVAERFNHDLPSWEKKYLLDAINVTNRAEILTTGLISSILSLIFFPSMIAFAISVAHFLVSTTLVLRSYLRVFALLSDSAELRRGGMEELFRSQAKFSKSRAKRSATANNLDQLLRIEFGKKGTPYVAYSDKSHSNVEVQDSDLAIVFPEEVLIDFDESGVSVAISNFLEKLKSSIPKEVIEELVRGESSPPPVFEVIKHGSAAPAFSTGIFIQIRVSESISDLLKYSAKHESYLFRFAKEVRGFIHVEAEKRTDFTWEKYIRQILSNVDENVHSKNRFGFSQNLDLLIKVYENDRKRLARER